MLPAVSVCVCDEGGVVASGAGGHTHSGTHSHTQTRTGDVRFYGVVPDNGTCLRAPLLHPNPTLAHVVVAAEEAAIKA